MATILFAPLPARGHVNPTFKIAKQLVARGHRVVYAGFADAEDYVLPEGFEYHRVFEDIFPKGFFTNVFARLGSMNVFQQYLFGRQLSKVSDRLYAAMLAGGIEQMFAQVGAELVIADVLSPQVSIVARGCGLPCFTFNTSVPTWREPFVPPWTSADVPRHKTLLLRLRIAATWARLRLSSRLKSLAGLDAHFERYLFAIAKKYGFPREKIHREGQWVNLELPELVLGAREFIELTATANRLEPNGPLVRPYRSSR